MKRLKTFLADDQGAVTVDWVVLVAAGVALTLAALNAFGTSMGSLATDIFNNMNLSLFS